MIGVSSILVRDLDMNLVICWICGNCPKSVSTDGNTKDSLKVSKRMVYDYDDTSDIPELLKFTDELIEEVLCSALFQYKSEKTYNMLKLPLLMPSYLLRKQVNNERLKQTIMEKQYEYKDETIEMFQDMVQTKEVRINGIKDLSVKQLGILGEKLNLANNKKTGEMIKIDLINLSNIFLGGQVVKCISFLSINICF